MNITLEQYILNPQIRSNAVLNGTAREAIRGAYLQKYNAVLMREHGKIDYTLYHDSKSNKYIAHFKIPSEVVSKFYYDTVLEFFTDENVKNTEDLFKYNVRFYSNDPAFVYTHAHAFASNDLFITDLSGKMSKKALKTEAKEKNPQNQIGYVKSIYFAYLTMKRLGLNKTGKFKAESHRYSKLALTTNITNADQKVADREAEGAKLTKTKKARTTKQKETNNISVAKSTLGVKKTKVIGSTINRVKTVKNTKRK